jgi:cytochrome c553
MRYILMMILVVVFSACESKKDVTKDVANTKAENEKAEMMFENKCQRCHGQMGKKKALNVSDTIAYYNKKDLMTALTRYKNSKRDKHRFGSLMTGIVKDLSKEDIRILADYIHRK